MHFKYFNCKYGFRRAWLWEGDKPIPYYKARELPASVKIPRKVYRRKFYTRVLGQKYGGFKMPLG